MHSQFELRLFNSHEHVEQRASANHIGPPRSRLNHRRRRWLDDSLNLHFPRRRQNFATRQVRIARLATRVDRAIQQAGLRMNDRPSFVARLGMNNASRFVTRLRLDGATTTDRYLIGTERHGATRSERRRRRFIGRTDRAGYRPHSEQVAYRDDEGGLVFQAHERLRSKPGRRALRGAKQWIAREDFAGCGFFATRLRCGGNRAAREEASPKLTPSMRDVSFLKRLDEPRV